MSRRASPAAVGLFVVVAVALAVVGLVLVGSGRLFHETYPFVVYFRGSVAGLPAGAPVTFRGVEVGRVRDVFVSVSGPSAGAHDVRIPVVIALDPARIGRPGAHAIGDPAEVGQLVDDGLRAQLATSSFVTNMRYVALDIFPGSKKQLVGDAAIPYPEIPSLPTDLENAEKQLGDVLARLSRVDIEALFHSGQRTLDGIGRLMTMPEIEETLRSIDRSAKSFEETMHNLNGAAVAVRRMIDEVEPDVVATGKNVRRASEKAALVADRAEALVASLRDVVEPAGPALFRLKETLVEVTATARALRHLVDGVGRDPGILIRGGNP